MAATTHTVVYGDTLSEIAQKYKGDYGYTDTYKYMYVLVDLNNIADPNILYVGQVIKLTGTAASKSSSSKTSSNTNQVVISGPGLISNNDKELYITWTWGKETETASYKIEWDYQLSGKNTWFVGSHTSTNVDSDNRAASRQSRFSIPDNAANVRVRVKPIAVNTKDSKGNESPKWSVGWSGYKYYDPENLPPIAPGSAPNVEIKKLKLTASYDNLDMTELHATHIQFQVFKDESTKSYASYTAAIDTNGRAAHAFDVAAGGSYKVRARSYRKKLNKYSAWTDLSSAAGTAPSAPSKLEQPKANSETSVYLQWSSVSTAETYDIEYAIKESYFDYTDQTTTKTGIKTTTYEVTGLESGQKYFFRVRAVNGDGESPWTGIKSVVIGKKPAAPTTWSSTTTAIAGEPLNLYWVHNAEDNSSETYAELELIIGGETTTEYPKKSTAEEEKDKTSVWSIDTSGYTEGTKILWRVRTAGITSELGDWSVQRTIDIYAPPVLQLNMTDINGNEVETLTAFPFKLTGIPGPATQIPTGYHVSIVSNDIYETVDNIGNEQMVNAGQEVYSKFFDISDDLDVDISAGDINLDNGVNYTVKVTVSMDSGLTAEATHEFVVSWGDESYSVNAEISINEDDYTASIRPYCQEYRIVFYKVTYDGNTYTATTEEVEMAEGVPVLIEGVLETEFYYAYTDTGEKVFTGTTTSGESVYYCTVEETTMVEGITLSVYRREYDGTFTEIATGLDNSMNITVVDPHPSLDLARYRIVGISKDTGAVSYYDMPGYPVNCHSIIIQWDEQWSNFEVTEDAESVQPPWSGSLLKIPYNIDVSNSNDSDVGLIKYAGRKNPVAYYGTQIGEKAGWSVVIPKNDKEILYGIRRLAIWMGNVYVREPSGSGYWASIKVSYNQKHCDPTIPVSIDITRVEGGI